MKKHDFLKGVDKKIIPGDDFFSYVNNNWIKKHPIPNEQSSWAIFHVLAEDIKHSLRGLLESISKKEKLSPELQKLNDFYNSGMDEARLKREKGKALDNLFKLISGMKTKKDLTSFTGKLHSIGIFPLWAFFVEPDDKNSKKNIFRIFQSGLILPDREYYLSADKKFKDIRKKYLTHIENLSRLFGSKFSISPKESKIILGIETELAKGSMTRVELRNIEAQYNKTSLNILRKKRKNILWSDYFKIIGVKEEHLKTFLINQPKFIEKVDSLIAKISVDDWKKYFMWHIMKDSVSYLDDTLIQEDFNFRGKIIAGKKTLRPRWKRVVDIVDSSMGEVLGKLYVEKFFPMEAKRKMNMMIDDIFVAYRDRIKRLDWMGEATKKKALQKLSKIERKIGYPDRWEKYGSLKVGRDSFIQNHWNSQIFAIKKMFRKLDKPVDRKEWFMTPPTVNAYYWPNLNEIVFPAGILQPPSFDLRAPDAMNYGGIGSVISHEISHGFDDKGSTFDGFGNMKNWWTKDDRARFEKKTEKLVSQYGSYEVLPGMCCNGKLTLGENIADLGGVCIAYEALMNRIKKEPKKQKTINGFTPEQQFFMAWAREWAGSIRKEEMRNRLITDPHSPLRLRTNAVLANIDEFYTAFKIGPKNKLYLDPKERVKIW